jgi:hypothetical protein
VLEAIVQLLRFAISVDGSVVPDFLENASPAEVQADGHILAEMLHGTYAVVELVSVLILVQMGVIEVRIPGGLAIGHEVSHISPSQRAGGIHIRGVQSHHGSKILPTRPRPEDSAARVVALGDKFLEQCIDHQQT